MRSCYPTCNRKDVDAAAKGDASLAPPSMSALSSFSRKRKLQQQPRAAAEEASLFSPAQTQEHDHDMEQALASSQLEQEALSSLSPTPQPSRDYELTADLASSQLEQEDTVEEAHMPDTSSRFNPFAAFAADDSEADVSTILQPLSGSPLPPREKRAKATAASPAAAKKKQQQSSKPPLTRIVKAHPAPQRDSSASSKPKAPSLLTAFFSGGSGSAPKPAASTSKGKKDKEGCLDPDDLDNMAAAEREACTRKWQLMADKDARREVQRFQVQHIVFFFQWRCISGPLHSAQVTCVARVHLSRYSSASVYLQQLYITS
jgi:hypothetical protein